MKMRLLKWGSKMPSTKQYNLVTNDDYDTRIPLHPEEAFQYGITFHAKYIGTMDVPRPTSRVEIVAAMRRIRYEFKAKGVKKKKVTVEVSIDGVKVSCRHKKIKRKEGSKLFGGFGKKIDSSTNDSGASSNGGKEILHHPIYRIFYVSHDSSDLKIFSYIARDGATNLFRCNVFKSNKKSQAMRIVRTVGQAFEVCHKLSTNGPDPTASCSNTEEPAPSVSEAHSEPTKKEAVSECSGWEAAGSSSTGEASTSAVVEKFEKPAVRPQKLELLPPPPRKENRRSPQRLVSTPTFPSLPDCVTKVEPLPAPSSADGAGSSLSSSTPLSAQHELQLLKERLEQQSQQTRAAVAQLLLLRDQLAAEQAARCEAQARTHQLLVHNKELLDHITALVAHLQERERGSRHTPISVQQLTLVPQKFSVHAYRKQATPTTQGTPVSILSSHIPNDNSGIIELLAQTSQMKASASVQNLQNNNLSPFTGSPIESTLVNGETNAFPNSNITTEQLITQFQNLSSQPQASALNFNQQYFQNCNAFPNIPPLINHYNNLDLERLIQQNQVFTRSNMNLQQIGSMQSPQSPNSSISQSSLFTPSPAATSKDSTPDGVSSDEGTAFIMPLSHSTTLTTTDTNGRVRLIVPVSPSGSTSDFGDAYLNNNNEPSKQNKISEVTLNITDESGNTRRALPAAPPITRTTSEKVPNRSEMMATMRAQWTRHTTK